MEENNTLDMLQYLHNTYGVTSIIQDCTHNTANTSNKLYPFCYTT